MRQIDSLEVIRKFDGDVPILHGEEPVRKVVPRKINALQNGINNIKTPFVF
jgi:hypothetical protein